MSYAQRDRTSDSPFALDVPNPATTVRRPKVQPRRFPLLAVGAGVSFALLVAGIFLSVVTRPGDQVAAASASAITDTVVHLHGKDLPAECWDGQASADSARLTVAMEVGIDGKIRYATASGSTPELQGCVESHVKSWEFLTQARAQTMALPVEVDRL